MRKGYFQYLSNKIGWGLLLIGVGPLFLVIFLAKLGIWPDPNPNPVGLGMMAALTVWPGMLFVFAGSLFWVKDRFYSPKNTANDNGEEE